MTFSKVLIANRGEIARRIMRSCHGLGYGTVAVYSDADRGAPFVRDADEALWIGSAASADSYLRSDRLLEAALRSGAGAIHPGYGFLAESADFAAAVEVAGLIFIGPTPDAIRIMGSKIASKQLMVRHEVPVIPGGKVGEQGDAALLEEAKAVGFPILLKASAGGGGKGMRIVEGVEGFQSALEAGRREAMAAFGDGAMLVEKYLRTPRHIEFQIVGDGQGNVRHVLERECTIQRRHQKLIEETPSTLLEAYPELRAAMAKAAVRAGEAVGYRSVGTVEFVVDARHNFYFLEMNTRLQVEHPITEEITGLDLVELQLRIAAGEPLTLRQEDVKANGHAIECRIYAEDPENDFLPCTGELVRWQTPDDPHLRVETGVESGSDVSMHYDPMLAKLITWGPRRRDSSRRMVRALANTVIAGPKTNRRFLLEVLQSPEWDLGAVDTELVGRMLAGERVAPPLETLRAQAATAASLVEALQVDAARAILPSLPMSWRNSRWRPNVAEWTCEGERLQISFTAQGAARFDVVVGDDAALQRRFRAWLAQRYATTEALREAWAAKKGLRADETLESAELLTLPLLVAEGYSKSRRHDSEAFRASERQVVRVVERWEGGLRLELAGHIRRFSVERKGERCWVQCGGEQFVFDAVPHFPEAQARVAEGSCRAPMPGKVIQLLVAAGDPVVRGQTLLTLEAMKMESAVCADQDGVVEEILVTVGELVDADAVLVRLAKAEKSVEP